ncbi:MAG: methyl-accepting chemotaxis protein [Spirochaetaceae bacterium]|nr:methyl-accepting chemotaxis protein [Myxococcales bacterium]MCB9726401.1 methyl-accepting chemotaxis protein [Spirochaetaceae bacterium]
MAPTSSRSGLRSRLVWLMIGVGVLPALVVAIVGWARTHQSLEEAAKDAELALLDRAQSGLEGEVEARRLALEDYFHLLEDQVRTFSENEMVVEAMRELPGAVGRFRREARDQLPSFETMRASLRRFYVEEFGGEYRDRNGRDVDWGRIVDGLDEDTITLQYAYIAANPNPLGAKLALDADARRTHYNDLHATLHPIVRSYLERFGYYDIFLVDAETGRVVYSVFKELDYATSLVDGPYAESNLAEVFRRTTAATAADAVAMVDFARYAPSYESPASFLASPIFDGGKRIGAAIFQVPLDRISEIMSTRAGLGETGEVFVVGPDRLLRSDSYVDPTRYSVAAAFAEPDARRIPEALVADALGGGRGTRIGRSIHDREVITAFAPARVGAFVWAVIADIGLGEALEPVAQLRSDSARAERQAALWTVAALVVLAIVVVLLARVLAGRVSGPILDAVGVLDRAADGDLRMRVAEDGVGELARMGAAMNRMLEGLNEVLVEVRGSAHEVSQTSEQFAVTSRDLSRNAERSSDSVQMIASTIEEISSQTEQSAGHAEEAMRLASEASELGEAGDERMKEMLEAMQAIDDASVSISRIIKVIDEIAFQTNLLALNAAVEAARAGAHGKGFAVVAEEVRSLAERSAEAARETTELIEGATGRVARGRQIAESTAESLSRIVESVSEASQLVSQIAAASREQADAIAQANTSLVQVDDVARDNASASTEMAAAARALRERSARLEEALGRFRILEPGSGD